MNNSGRAVKQLMSKYKIAEENLLVIYDDYDLPKGKVRIRAGGSAGTHNGMRSVIGETGLKNFPRIRLGIRDEAVDIPIILYNVPSRTGVDIPVSIYKRLSALPNVAGVKEANTNITRISHIRQTCGEDFYIWSGNDDQIVPILSLGGIGVISVLSNIMPETKSGSALS